MNLTDFPSSVSGEQESNAGLKGSHTRLQTFQADCDNYFHENDVEVNDKMGDSDLRQYIRHLKKKNQGLENDVQTLKEYNASQHFRLKSTQHHVEMLETYLANALNASNIFQHEKDVVLALQASERERMASTVILLEEAQNRYEDAERARQSTFSKLSSLQALSRIGSSQDLLSSIPLLLCNGSLDHNEHIEKHKRNVELPRRKFELTEEQAAERQKVAVSLAPQDAQLDYTKMLEHVKEEFYRRELECEAARAKEQGNAIDKDRYGTGLETRYALQRSQADQRVAFYRAQMGLGKEVRCSRGHVEIDFPIGTLDEVLVRMQLEHVRTRRFEALKKSLLIRHAKQNQATREHFCRWKLQSLNVGMMRLRSVQCMHRIMLHFTSRRKLSYFNKWRDQVRQLQARTSQMQALVCCNRLIAVERIRHVLIQITVKRAASFFHRWHQRTLVLKKGGSLCISDNAGMKEENMQSLQQEIKKLHSQLTSTRSEAWRYKRQLLNQFL